MGLLILIAVLLIIINIFTTSFLPDMLKDTRLDRVQVYRICLIPPLGVVLFSIAMIIIIIMYLLIMVKQIWR